VGAVVPASILHLGSNGAANVYVTLCNAATGGKPAIIGLSNSGDVLVAVSSNNNLLFVTSNVERMRITSNGLIGIGTASPGNAVTIVTTSATTIPLSVTGVGTSGGGTPVAQFFNSNGVPVIVIGNYSNSNLFINYTSNTNTAQIGVYGGTSAIYITSNNVGVGITPSYPLHVAGQVFTPSNYMSTAYCGFGPILLSQIQASGQTNVPIINATTIKTLLPTMKWARLSVFRWYTGGAAPNSAYNGNSTYVCEIFITNQNNMSMINYLQTQSDGWSTGMSLSANTLYISGSWAEISWYNIHAIEWF
jgi:hypothetical protein